MSYRTDMASAALRHLDSAQTLLEAHQAFDQAWHLAGFGPECAVKSSIEGGGFHRVLGHSAADTTLLEWVRSVDGTHGSAGGPPPLGHWSPNDRYEPTGTYLQPQVEAFVSDCSAYTLGLLGDLWCRGLTPEAP